MIAPQDKTILTEFTSIAKKILYNKDRAESIGKIMESGPDGPISAVQTVLGGIEQMKPIPPNIKAMLAVNVFMVIVDLTQEITGEEIPPKVLIMNIGKILNDINKEVQPTQQGAQPNAQPEQGEAPQGGIIGRQLQGAIA